MITSIYEAMFDQLLLGKPIQLPKDDVNQSSVRVQWSRYKSKMFGDILNNKSLVFEEVSNEILQISLVVSKRRTSVQFTVVEQSHATETIPNNLESDKTCEGGADP